MRNQHEWQIRIGNGHFDPIRRLLITGTTRTRISPLESEVLFCLAQQPDIPMPLRTIAAEVWGHATRANTDAYRQVLRTLRQKLRESGIGVDIVSMNGYGYRLLAHTSPASALVR
jgi:DNA-binding response OmpR family regulator